MTSLFHTRLAENGRILIPAECRKLLGLRPDEDLLLRIDAEGMHIMPLVQQLRRFRQKVRGSLKPGQKLMDNLREIRADDVD